MIKKAQDQLIGETSSEVHEYILSIQCPVCGKEVVSLLFGSDDDDELKEDICEHTVYLNNYHCNVYADESKQNYLKELIAYNMNEEGEEEEDIQEFMDDDLICGDEEFEYEYFLGDPDGESVASFFSENHPDKEFIYLDSSRDFGDPVCGCTIAYSAVFLVE